MARSSATTSHLVSAVRSEGDRDHAQELASLIESDRRLRVFLTRLAS
jgi:hypothetical protein